MQNDLFRTVGYRGRLMALIGFFCAVAFVFGGEPLVTEHSCPAQADIRFHGTSTLHDFTGTVKAQPFVLVLSSNAWSAKAAVAIGQMNTASEGRDKNMWKMFGTNQHPLLQGEVKSAALPPAGTNAMLTFTVRDQAKALPALISDWQEDAETIRFHAEWDVSLKQFGLKPPSVIGVIRVGDRVHVAADVTASKNASLNPAAQPKP